MKYTRNALGLLNAQYRSVLKKCLLINLGLFALGAGAANAEDYSLKAEDLSTSKNIIWKEISADEYEADNPNMLKVELSADKTQYFEYTYTKPEVGTVYNERKEGKEGALTGDITADFKDSISNVDGGALSNAAGNTLNITGDFLNNQIDNTGSGNYGGAIYNLGTISINGDMIGNSIVRDDGAFGGAISTENNANITEIIGNYIGNYLVSNTRNALGGAIFNHNKAEIDKIEGKFIGNYAIGNLDENGKIGAEGGAINNWGSEIKSITGEFINNYTKNADGQSSATGGAIGNREANGVIGNIEAVFINNYSTSLEGLTQGGAIYNFTDSHIGDIKGKFSGNHLWSKIQSGGGAILNMNATMDNIYADFTNNYIYSENYSRGGAIANEKGDDTYTGEISIKDVVGNFINNYAEAKNSSARGGAIYNSLATIDNITGDFIGNYAKSVNGQVIGGAIYNKSAKIGDITGDFTGNYAKSEKGVAQGGAIYNFTDSHIGDVKGKFSGNHLWSKKGSVGGAILNMNAKMDNIYADFTNNYIYSEGHSHGGAIANVKGDNTYTGEISIKDVVGNFINNYAEAKNSSAIGGAMYNVFATIDNITGDFSGNYAQSINNISYGGAIANMQSSINEIKGNFTSNYVLGGANSNGGAINNNTNGIIVLITGDFEGNYAESNGGAAMARGGALFNMGSITNLTANFSNNHALTNGTFAIGGAVTNKYNNANSKGITTLSGNFSNNFAQTTGAGNNAYAQGGAIYNSARMAIDDIQSSTFSGNYVSGAREKKTDGGAVWNAGTIGFSGKNVFKDNYKVVNGVKTANDIYNSGTVNVAENGSLDISDGITGGITGDGKINLAQNAALNLNNATSAGNNLTLEKDATLAFNVNEINTSSTTQKGGKVDGDIKLNADSNLKVSTYVEHGVANGEGTYKFANTVDTANGKWNPIITNSLYNYDFRLNDENNTLILEFAKKNADEIAKEFDTSKDKADEILAITDSKSDNQQFDRISETVNKQAQDGDKNLTSALDDLNDNTQANLETGRYIGDIIAKNVADRLNTRPDKSSVYGLAGGDVAEYEPEVWANAVYQTAENSGDLDYSADTKGVIAAVDGKAGKNWTVGAGYAYLQTDLDSGAKSSDIDDHTVFAYAEYGRNSWFANGLAAYHWLSFDQNKKAFGENIKGSFDMQMLGLQALVGREFYGCADEHVLRLRPQAGLRYYKISQDGYTDSAGMKYNSADSDILTGVLGVSLTDETEVNGYEVMPKAFVNATYDLQNDDNTTIVHLPNGGSYAIAQESNGKFGVETGIGVEMAVSENAKVGLTYEYDWRDDYSAHTGLLNLKYAF